MIKKKSKEELIKTHTLLKRKDTDTDPGTGDGAWSILSAKNAEGSLT